MSPNRENTYNRFVLLRLQSFSAITKKNENQIGPSSSE